MKTNETSLKMDVASLVVYALTSLPFWAMLAYALLCR